jgi:hypothetical protein
MRISSNPKRAEDLFREAFERLKANAPVNIPVGSKLTQGNIAREADKDPTAFKKDRYPLLILEIQAYIKSQKDESVAKRKASDNRSRTDKQKLANWKKQVDKYASINESLLNHIETLEDELSDLKEGKIERLDF